MIVVVASKNPVKTKAVELGFRTYFSHFEIRNVSVSSGVPDQPKTDVETKQGALNRAKNARQKIPAADYWIGIEGGLEKNNQRVNAFAWVAVISELQTETARTATFRIPPKVAELIDSGYELGHANDLIFNKNNSKQKQGAVGLLTFNKVTRTQLYVQAIQLSLIPFINKKLY